MPRKRINQSAYEATWAKPGFLGRFEADGLFREFKQLGGASYSTLTATRDRQRLPLLLSLPLFAVLLLQPQRVLKVHDAALASCDLQRGVFTLNEGSVKPIYSVTGRPKKKLSGTA